MKYIQVQCFSGCVYASCLIRLHFKEAYCERCLKMKVGVFIVVALLSGCAENIPVQSSITPFSQHISRSNAEIIARYTQAREAGFSHGSAYQYARGDRTYSAEQLDVIGLNEMLNDPQLV